MLKTTERVYTKLPVEIWFEIFLSLSVKSLYMLRATCRDIRHIVDERSVWLSVLVDLLHIKPSVYSQEDINGMSVSQLREASQRIVQVDRAFSSATLPHREVRILDSVKLATFAKVALLPGGDRAIILKENGSFDIHDIATGNVLLSAPRIEGSPVTKSFMRLYPKSLYTGHILVNAGVHINGANGLWRDRFNSGEFHVYHYTRTEIRHIWTEECPREMSEGRFTFCQQRSTLLLAQLHAPSDKLGDSHLELHLRTIYENGQSDKEILKFRLETEVEVGDMSCPARIPDALMRTFFASRKKLTTLQMYSFCPLGTCPTNATENIASSIYIKQGTPTGRS
ncbi:hypothetical protein BDY19DRAFT_323188 [Irpex rosettiformis]|uniref:Uncharacterized protein n=1 Tax=Irpex rosettiformis TaxID=378272 RepID=A0ACB8TY80_9APHY|nr:hypothetical protein BDY19DRAFT_323188 [Irpex rosettiformis]